MFDLQKKNNYKFCEVNPFRSRAKWEKLLKFLFLYLLWGSSKVFIKVSNAFIEPFWGTNKRSENKEFTLIFILIPISEMHLAERVSKHI